MARSRDQVVELIFSVLKSSKDQPYIGEPISQLEHALQAAALAAQAGAADEVILAALLHDVGHLDLEGESPAEKMEDYGILEHEKIGAQWVLKLGLLKSIAELILGHVEAKRFLVFKHPHYLENLSPASIETLKRQGGPMSAAEAARFESNALFKDKLRLRAWDDQAKLIDYKVPGLEAYREKILASLDAANSNS